MKKKKDVLVCLRAQGEWHTSLTLVYGAVKVKRRHIKRKGETKEEEASGPTERENRGLLMLHGSRLPGLQHELPVWYCRQHGKGQLLLPHHHCNLPAHPWRCHSGGISKWVNSPLVLMRSP